MKIHSAAMIGTIVVPISIVFLYFGWKRSSHLMFPYKTVYAVDEPLKNGTNSNNSIGLSWKEINDKYFEKNLQLNRDFRRELGLILGKADRIEILELDSKNHRKPDLPPPLDTRDSIDGYYYCDFHNRWLAVVNKKSMTLNDTKMRNLMEKLEGSLANQTLGTGASGHTEEYGIRVLQGSKLILRFTYSHSHRNIYVETITWKAVLKADLWTES